MKSNSNSIIQSLCIGNKNFGVMEELSIISYLRNGHQFHLYTYDNNIKVPRGTMLFDANEILERNSLDDSILSDIFRYQLLHLKGGWWVNLDTICIRPFEFKSKYVFTKILDYNKLNGIADSFKIGSHIMKVPVSTEILYDCLNYIRLRGLHNLISNEINIDFLNAVLFNYKIKYYCKKAKTFSPYHYHEVYEFVKPNGSIYFNKNIYAISLWKEMWLKMGLNPNRKYINNSIYEQLKNKYCDNLDSGVLYQ